MKRKRRDETLLFSRKELDEDNSDLMLFIQTDNVMREQKVQEQRMQEQEKSKKEDEIKKLDAQIQQEKSEIEKNKDALLDSRVIQNFVLSLKPQFEKEKNEKMARKMAQLKASWIERYKKDRSQDHIIFQDDEEIHDQVKMKFAYLKEKEQNTVAGARDRRSQRIDERDRVTDEEWGERFQDLLEAHLIDVPDNFYDEVQAFNDPDELNTIFNELEEQNLFNIHQLQELELQLEQLNQEQKDLETNLHSKFEQQNRAHKELEVKIRESTLNLAAAEKKTTGDLLFEPPDNDKIRKDEKAGKVPKPEPVDFQIKLFELVRQISDIYQEQIGLAEVSGKSPIALLDVSIVFPFKTQRDLYSQSLLFPLT